MECKNLINGQFPVSTPEEQGIRSEYIIDFMDEIKKRDCHLHSFQILRHGKLIAGAVASPFTMDSYHRIYSAAKGVVATGILVAIQEGYFGIDDRVLDILPPADFPDIYPDDMDEKWGRLTVYHLLTMTTGHKRDTLFAMMDNGEFFKTFFEAKPDFEPGTYFCYDMGAQYVMNELVRLKTGPDMGQFLKPRIFDPMEIEYQNKQTPCGRFFSSTIQFKPDALTKFAQLYLQKGRWNGEQLIREDLATLAHKCLVANDTYDNSHDEGFDIDDFAGYGLHMWRNSAGGFRFCGGQGQLAIVFPEQDIAIGTFAAEDNCNIPLQAFVDTVLYKVSERPLPPNDRDYRKLQRRLESFSMAADDVTDRSSTLIAVDSRTYTFEDNTEGQKTIRFLFDNDTVTIESDSAKGIRKYTCGLCGKWCENEGFLLLGREDGDIADLDLIYNYDPTKTLLTGGWKSQNVFEIRMRSHAMLCDYRFRCEFICSDACKGNGEDNNVNTTGSSELEITVTTKAHDHHVEGEDVGLFSKKPVLILRARC